MDNLDATALAAETLELALHLAAATEDHDHTCRCLYAHCRHCNGVHLVREHETCRRASSNTAEVPS